MASTLLWSLASLLPSGGDRGGGEKAHGSPGRGEEDKYRGWKVRGGVDEAQCRREEKEGESIGGRDRDGVPGAGGELGHDGRRQRLGTGRPRGGCPSVAFRRGGSLLPPPGDHCVPVDGDTYDVPMQIAMVIERSAISYRKKFGDEKQQKELSPVTHVAKGKNIPPFLILHVAGHPETGGQSQRLVKELQAAGISASAYPSEGKTHGSINADLGKVDDKPTIELYLFLEKVLKK